MNAEDALLDAIKAMSPSQFPDKNIKSCVSTVRALIQQLEKSNHWDSKLNGNLCRTLANSGGENDHECSFALHQMLGKTSVKCLYRRINLHSSDQ